MGPQEPAGGCSQIPTCPPPGESRTAHTGRQILGIFIRNKVQASGTLRRIHFFDVRDGDFQRGIKFLQLSDQLQSSAVAKFLLGASAFSLGQSAVNDANEKRSCDLARMARDAFNLASLNLPAGGQKYPNEAAQLMTAIPQFTPAVDNEVKRFCK